MQVYHYHNDHLGTPNELTNSQGEVIWLADYQAWGNTARVVWRKEKLEQLQVSADELQPIRFQGQSFDIETGLHYNRFRYFDPDLGMFISRDPIGLMGGDNIFKYNPNPINWVDPLGLEGYRIWQVHSPGYDDIVQKGLHFYATGNIELSVRPDHLGGITFTNAIPNQKGSPKVIKAISEAKQRFCENSRFRNDILAKATEGVSSILAHRDEQTTESLRNLANGRSRELRDIQRNITRYNIAQSKCKE